MKNKRSLENSFISDVLPDLVKGGHLIEGHFSFRTVVIHF